MAMAEWQQYTQSVIFGLVFSFLLAKLFSIIFSFRDENLRITRPNPSEDQIDVTSTEPDWKSTEDDKRSDAEFPKEHISGREIDPLVGTDSDDDWEGVENTELDEAFSAASAFAAATAANRSSRKLPNDLKLQLYGLYKIATEGPCCVPQPSAIKMTARVKWNAWQKLGSMPTEEAMQKYIEIITELYPTWADGLKSKRRDGSSKEPSSNETKPMGPVFSTFGGIDVAEVLFSRNADVTLADNEGQESLHNAVVCERGETAELLVKRNAGNVGIKDDDGPGSNPS